MFSIGRSSYYAWLIRKPSKRQRENEHLDNNIASIFTENSSRYGSPPIKEEEQGITCRKNRVASRMRYLGLLAKAKKKFKVTTDLLITYPLRLILLIGISPLLRLTRSGWVISAIFGLKKDGCIGRSLLTFIQEPLLDGPLQSTMS